MAYYSGKVVDKNVCEILNKIISLFPGGHSFMFAYGSGILRQVGYESDFKRKMLDLIIVVDDPLKWHQENLKKNKHHYSLLRFGGPNVVSKIQQNFGAGIYYNTLVPFENRYFKYGVISTSQLLTDLLDWDTLYVSGRLHKPIVVLHPPTNSQLKTSLKVNLQNALHTVLLQLPETFYERELYLQLAGLSYSGDFRMMLAEDPNKVQSIVIPQIHEFRRMYAPHILSMNHVIQWNQQTQKLEQDCSPSARLHHLNLLPKKLQHRLLLTWNKDGRNLDLEDVLKATAQDIDCAEIITDGIEYIIQRSSLSQSLKGIVTAGLWKSVRYGGAKLGKALWSIKR